MEEGNHSCVLAKPFDEVIDIFLELETFIKDAVLVVHGVQFWLVFKKTDNIPLVVKVDQGVEKALSVVSELVPRSKEPVVLV